MENAIPLPTTWFMVLALFATVGLLAIVSVAAIALGKHSLPVPETVRSLYAKFRSFMRNGLNDEDPKQQLYHYGPFKWWAFVLLAIELPLVILLAFQSYPFESTFPFGWYDAYKTSGLPFDILAAFAAGLGVIIAIHRSELSALSHRVDQRNTATSNYYNILENGNSIFKKQCSKQEYLKDVNVELSPSFIIDLFEDPRNGNFNPNPKFDTTIEEVKGGIHILASQYIENSNQAENVFENLIKNGEISEQEINWIKLREHRFSNYYLETISLQLTATQYKSPATIDFKSILRKHDNNMDMWVIVPILVTSSVFSALMDTLMSLPIDRNHIDKINQKLNTIKGEAENWLHSLTIRRLRSTSQNSYSYFLDTIFDIRPDDLIKNKERDLYITCDVELKESNIRNNDMITLFANKALRKYSADDLDDIFQEINDRLEAPAG